MWVKKLTNNSLKGFAAMDVRMIDEANSIFNYEFGDDVKPFFIKGAIYKLLAMLINEIKSQNERLISESGVAEAVRMNELKNLLINDFTQPCPNIEDMARKAYMSVSKFQSLFKKLFKMSYYQYYQHYRLMTARDFLSHGMLAKDVAIAVGFVNQAQFTAAFKKKFQILPSDIK